MVGNGDGHDPFITSCGAAHESLETIWLHAGQLAPRTFLPRFADVFETRDGALKTRGEIAHEGHSFSARWQVHQRCRLGA
ncbi:MAG: hypothetical protein AB7O62_02995 [Pirellulales bacterium]